MKIHLKQIIGGALVSIALMALAFGSVAANGGANGSGHMASGFGSVNIGGETLLVEVIVAVAPGNSDRDVVNAALAQQGARPIDDSASTTTGLFWNQFADGSIPSPTVQQNYNGDGDPTGSSGAAALQSTQDKWGDVSGSRLALGTLGLTTACPSLVRSCKGPQVRDGANDVAWLAIGGCCTLGVTWYTTSGVPEADMALNAKFNWNTDGSNYDVETVLLHENGHVAGLGHSTEPGAVMEATYAGVRRALTDDDRDGLVGLYPSVPINIAPVADAGPDVTATDDGSGSATVTLDGSGSSDPNGDAFTYLWSTHESKASIDVKVDVGTSATFTLTVTDGGGLSDSDSVTVTVNAPSDGGPCPPKKAEKGKC